MKRIIYSIGVLCIVLVSFLYALQLIQSQVTFGFDQARDAYEAASIWQGHHIKILGPSSDVSGLNHGVLWYYFLAVAYAVSHGDPDGAAAFMLCLLYMLIPIIGFITYRLSKNYQITLQTVILYSFAPLCVSFTHWLSNPTLSLFVTPLVLFGIWHYIQKQKPIVAFLLGIGFGLLIQSDFAFLMLLCTVPLYMYFFKLKFIKSHFFLFSVGLLIALTSFIVSYVKFHTNIFQIILSFLVTNTGGSFSTSGSLLGLLDGIVNIFSITYMPFPRLLVFCVLLLIVIFHHKKIFDGRNKLILYLLIWMSGILFLFIFNHGSLGANFLYAPFLFSAAFLLSLIMNLLITNKVVQYAVIILIVIFQIALINNWNTIYYNPLSIQTGITTKFEKDIINYTYKSAQKKPFVINSITNPLYINTTWAYLYDFYGYNKYHYLPYWGGKDQTGYLGDLPQNPPASIILRYFIIEPQEGISDLWGAKGMYDEDKISDLMETKKFGNYIIQKRLFHPNKGRIVLPEILINNPKVFNN